VTTAVEHHSVGHTMRYLEKFGFEIVELPVDRYGRVDPERCRGRDHAEDDSRERHARQQ
jgi:cysteine sulfinate desulfinase/cysteine desulfurase-like protein